MTVRNRGSNYSATGVVFKDELPAEVEYVSSTLPGCTLGEDDLSCAIGTVGKSSSVAGTITVRAIQPGTAHNAASIRGDQERSRDLGNNAAELDTPIAPVADLSIEQTASRDPVPAGESFDYTFTVSNAGPDSAQDVAISYDLPEGIDFVSSPDCTESARTVTCSIGEIPAGTSVARTITVLAARAGDAGSTATVGGAVDDPAPENNEVTTTTVVAAKPVGSSPPPSGPTRLPTRFRSRRSRPWPAPRPATSSSERPPRPASGP